MKQKLNKKGFTLIELLVVVAIIAILAGIVLVSLNSATERSKKASLQSTLSSAMPVASMCLNDGGNVNPPAANTEICTTSDITEEWPALLSDITPDYSYGNATMVDEDSDGEAEDWTITGTGPDGYIVTCQAKSGSCTTSD
ncbi:MAG: type II secretion system protein [Candidatus Moranbacteria bacterium]|nr:type II secretion system protein [Candidatus Moranbacteria bacterium]